MFSCCYVAIETVKGRLCWHHTLLDGSGLAYRYANGKCTVTHIASGLAVISCALPCERDAKELIQRIARLANWRQRVTDMQKCAKRRNLKEKIVFEVEHCTGWIN
jgi:hypothetical protein